MCKPERKLSWLWRLVASVLCLACLSLSLPADRVLTVYESELRQLNTILTSLSSENAQLQLSLGTSESYSIALEAKLLDSANRLATLEATQQLSSAELEKLKSLLLQAETELMQLKASFKEYSSATESKIASLEGKAVVVGIVAGAGGVVVGALAAIIVQNWQEIQKWFQPPTR